jgi:serine/threonine protein kinase/dipeptidyl aminopeptidase/acylaminoacyl peptidase
MTLIPGGKLGPYEILGPLGAGGMGEVYRARDQRLARDVAIKVLPPSFLGEPERLLRFEQEARAAGQLNHPNIMAVYDIGTHEGTPYVVEELLEGDTLRQKMAGTALPPRKAIDYAGQIAQGLAAAHQKGIVHRDLKPENLFVTHDGRVKILDFGLAKLTGPAAALPSASQLTEAPTAIETGAGVVMGTVGYMSPEQVRGQAADHRSDIFSFGCVLYEMISGQRAFQRDSSVETMNAILREEPAEISQTRVDLPPGLERVVQHCLEKSPEERFQSARDLAFQIHALSSPSATATGRSGIAAAPRALKTRPWIAAAIVLLAMAAGVLAGRITVRPPKPTKYSQITFRQGSISAGRFTRDGDTVAYSASWDGNPTEIFTTRPGSPESRSLGLPPADILSVSGSGELAILLNPRFTFGFQRTGTLARVPLAGGVPREVLEDVQDADWAPDGSGLVVVRHSEGRYHLEYPVGKVLRETTAWISWVRFSRDGRRIAFIDHPSTGDNRGQIAVVDLAGTMKVLTGTFPSASGLAWSADGSEVWFTASETGNLLAVYAVDLAGHQRLVAGAPANLELFDIAADGKLLVSRSSWRRGMIGLAPGESTERDLSWLDWSRPGALSADGRLVLFEEQGEGGGVTYSIYLRKTDGEPAVKIGQGTSMALSPDGRWAATLPPNDTPDRIVFIPTGAGEGRTVTLGGLSILGAGWHPDGRHLLIQASEEGRLPRLVIIDRDGGAPRPLTGEEPWIIGAVSPDGELVAFVSQTGPGRLIPFEGGETRPLPGLESRDILLRWSGDGRGVFVARPESLPARIERVDVATGKRTLVKELMPADRAGLVDVGWILVAADGGSYVYSYRRNLAALYIGAGAR